MTLILCVIMFVSGAAALLFETLWFRQAGLAFGNSVWASSLVLASFMAGLALGNGLVARHGARIRHPIRFYALLEAAIGASGVLLVWLLPRLAGGLAPLWRSLLDDPWLLNPVRLLLAFSLLLVPATAMGATLPVLVKALQARDPNFGSVLGRLYGWNTLGAVLGAVAGEALLLDAMGVLGSGLQAAGLNAVAALCAWLLWLRVARSGAVFEKPVGPPPRLPGAAWLLLAAAFLAGGILLAFEVVWFRFLQLFVLNSSLSFALMLAVVLAGIGLGGHGAGFWLRRRPAGFGLVVPAALVAGAAAVASYGLFGVVLEPYGTRYALTPREILWLSAALMFPVSLLSGALFTCTGAALHRLAGPETRSAGLLTLANTVGAGLGALLGGFVLLPLLGVERSVLGLAAGYGLVALLLWGARVEAPARAGIWLRAVCAAGFAASLILFPFGAMQGEYLDVVARRFNAAERGKVVAFREGRTETILYVRAELLGEPLYHLLVTGGFAMASTGVHARRYMKQFVYWPVALHQGLERALLISYGSGSTAKALTDTPELEHIDVVDISREILEMSDLVYPDPSEHPLRDPRVRVHVEDGRFFLLTTPERYDLITSEPPPPKHAGVVNLYTKEYFALLHERLAEGGISTYWVPVHVLNLDEAKSIVRAYCEVFSDCSLWTGWGFNWMLAGSRDGAWARAPGRFERQWRDPRWAAELRAVAVEKPEQLGAMFIADAKQLREWTSGVEPLVDDFPKRLTDRLPQREDAEALYRWMDPAQARDRFRASDFIGQLWPEELRQGSLPYFAPQETVNELFLRMQAGPIRLDASLEPLHWLLTGTDLETLPLWLLNGTQDVLGAVDRLAAQRRLITPLFRLLGVRALAQRRFDRAARFLKRAQVGNAGDETLRFLRAYALGMAGRPAEAAALVPARPRARPDRDGEGAPWAWLVTTLALEEGP